MAPTDPDARGSPHDAHLFGKGSASGALGAASIVPRSQFPISQQRVYEPPSNAALPPHREARDAPTERKEAP